MNWQCKDWKSLSKEELYAILKLRQEVFVVEQHCPYLDCDDHDMNSLHLWLEDKKGITAYTRIAPPEEIYEETTIGRVITANRIRRTGVGRAMMEESLRIVESRFSYPIRIMAQSYLLPFYESCGFQKEGEEFLEDGLPHWEMRLDKG